MTIEKNASKYLWISAVTFITYLLLGSYIISKNLLDLLYLIFFYTILILNRVKK